MGRSDRETDPNRRVPYSSATDDQKVHKNWHKATGLFERREYSGAVLRCATSIELTVNLGIRYELVQSRGLPLTFVDKLLLSANGLHNKYQNLYLPIMAESHAINGLKAKWKHIQEINRQRNDIVHSGEFRSEETADQLLRKGYEVIDHIMSLYGFDKGLTLFPIQYEN